MMKKLNKTAPIVPKPADISGSRSLSSLYIVPEQPIRMDYRYVSYFCCNTVDMHNKPIYGVLAINRSQEMCYGLQVRIGFAQKDRGFSERSHYVLHVLTSKAGRRCWKTAWAQDT